MLQRAGMLLGLAVAIHGTHAWAMTTGAQNVARVRADIASGNCKDAVASLELGLAQHYPEVQLQAGVMYERGMCVAPDWRRAVQLYSLAFDNGQKAAAYRLAAGFAAPGNGPDVASALWWGSRVNVAGDCVPPAPARDNEDLFRAQLKTWTEQRLTTCNYLTGVMATIVAGMRYPTGAHNWSVGEVVITFKPALARIELTLDGSEQYLLGGDPGAGAQNNQKPGPAFVQHARAVAERALKRYPKPDGVPADIPDQKLPMRFRTEDARMPHFDD
ncbi:MAG: hypothetical protein ACXWKJ_21930 [Telluria sp.]